MPTFVGNTFSRPAVQQVLTNNQRHNSHFLSLPPDIDSIHLCALFVETRWENKDLPQPRRTGEATNTGRRFVLQ